MSEIEKAKATCARLKGHFTRAKNSLAKELEARKAPHIIENAYEEAKARLKNVVRVFQLHIYTIYSYLYMEFLNYYAIYSTTCLKQNCYKEIKKIKGKRQ